MFKAGAERLQVSSESSGLCSRLSVTYCVCGTHYSLLMDFHRGAQSVCIVAATKHTRTWNSRVRIIPRVKKIIATSPPSTKKKGKKKVLCRGILCDCIAALGIRMSCNVPSGLQLFSSFAVLCNSHTALGTQWAQSVSEVFFAKTLCIGKFRLPRKLKF